MSSINFFNEKTYTWQEFVSLKSSKPSPNCLYRGLPNKPKAKKEENWVIYDLKTTYQRKYKSPDITEFYRKLEDIQSNKGRYVTLKDYPVGDNTNLLPLILYLRHAGIPMPVLDFTYNPLTALYFSVHDLYTQYGVKTPCKTILENNPEGYVSIFEFDLQILQNNYGIEKLEKVYKFQEFIDDRIYLIEGTQNLNFNNPNMINQEGAFLFLSSQYSIDIFLRNQYLQSINTGSTYPKPITLNKITYESIFSNNINNSVYAFLEKNNKVGYKLFSDEQALQFDFINPSLLNI